MSNDMMPCGCKGHADNAGLCRYPELERELNEARAAREQTLRDWREYKAQKDAWCAQLEQARDEARQQLAETTAAWSVESLRAASEKAARERAEADNAALLAGLRAFRSLPPGLDAAGSSAPFIRAYTEAERRADELLAQPHPGAALLERLRALEGVREAAEPFRTTNVTPGPEYWKALRDACTASDALKNEG